METKDLPQSAIKGLNNFGKHFADNIMIFSINYHSIGDTTDVDEMYNRVLSSLACFENCKRQLEGMVAILEVYKED